MHFCRRTFERLSEKWCGADQLRRTTFWPISTPSRHAQAPDILETELRVLISCKKSRCTNNIDTSRFGYYDVRPLLFVSLHRMKVFYRRKKKKKLLVKCWLLRESSQKTCKQFRGMKSEGKADHLNALPLIIWNSLFRFDFIWKCILNQNINNLKHFS